MGKLSTMLSKATFAGLCCLAALPVAASAAYPEKTIKIVVPYPPGNASDTVGRVVAEQLSKRLGQAVVVDNRPGASGGIGARAVAQSDPDGYTLLMTSTSFTINTALTANLLYDVERDFDGISVLTSSGGMLLVVKPSLGVNTVEELVALLKQKPNQLNYGQAGRGTIQHLTMESFLAAVDAKAYEVAYKGSVQALTDIVGGNLDFMFDARGSATPFAQDGRVKLLAVSSERRLGALPELPTVQESGLPGLKQWSVAGWTGLLAPKGTPPAVIEKLNTEIKEILQSDAIQQRLKSLHMESLPHKNPAQVQAFLREDMKRWQDAATAAKLEKQ